MMPVLTPLPPSDVYILMLLLFLSAPRHLLPSGSALHFFLLLLSFTHSPSSSLCLALRSSSLSLLLSSFSTSALPSICFILISHLSSSRSVSLVIFFFFGFPSALLFSLPASSLSLCPLLPSRFSLSPLALPSLPPLLLLCNLEENGL